MYISPIYSLYCKITTVPQYRRVESGLKQSIKLKYDSKINSLNIEVAAVYLTIFLIQTASENIDWVELNFWSFMIRISLNFKSKGTKIIKVFFQATNDSQNLRLETLYIADYECMYFQFFCVENKAMTRRRCRLKHRSPFIFIKICSIEGSKLIKSFVVF